MASKGELEETDADADNARSKIKSEENTNKMLRKVSVSYSLAVSIAASYEKQKTREVKQKSITVAATNGRNVEEKCKEKNEVEPAMTKEVAENLNQVVQRDVQKQKKRHEEVRQDLSHIRRKAVSCSTALWDTIRWEIPSGSEVDAGQKLGTVGRLEDGNQRVMQAPCKGRLYILTEEQSEELIEQKNMSARAAIKVVAFVEYCIHPVRNGRTCLMCLGVVETDENDDELESVNVVSHGQVIRLNIEEASTVIDLDVSALNVQCFNIVHVAGVPIEKFDSDNIRRQLSAKKLSLVLDLDHTLLHAVRVEDVVGDITKADDIYFFYIPGLAQQHVVKLRPGLMEFLAELFVLYDFFIYTHGTRLYAEQIVKIIDPDDTFFKNRIVARTDTPDMLHKSLKLLFPSCDDSMILVLDDRIDVWKENEANVFLIEPYHYFNSTSEINNASGRGMAGYVTAEDEASEDTHLVKSTKVLKHVHKAFYAGHESGMQGTSAEDQMACKNRDVKIILNEQKRAILHGCFIVFSGVFPIIGSQSHESYYLWRLCVDLGATPSMTLKDFPLTHLVIHPERLGTQKHVEAKTIPGVRIVTPDWILKCCRSWSRVPEDDFLADEWEGKHARRGQVTEVEDLKVLNKAITPCETPSDVLTDTSSCVDEKHTSTAAALVPHDKTVANSLDRRNIGNVENYKKVTFAKTVDVQEHVEKDKIVQKSKIVRRPRESRRSSGAVATGIVAQGGTFDFLLKINATKRGPSVSVKKETAEVASNSRARPKSPPKDVHDALSRLVEAEERENEEKRKRKQSSTDVKDMLFTRRVKKDTSQRIHDSHVQPDGNRMRGTQQIERAANLEGDEDELDDLEADILGAL